MPRAHLNSNNVYGERTPLDDDRTWIVNDLVLIFNSFLFLLYFSWSMRSIDGKVNSFTIQFFSFAHHRHSLLISCVPKHISFLFPLVSVCWQTKKRAPVQFSFYFRRLRADLICIFVRFIENHIKNAWQKNNSNNNNKWVARNCSPSASWKTRTEKRKRAE